MVHTVWADTYDMDHYICIIWYASIRSIANFWRQNLTPNMFGLCKQTWLSQVNVSTWLWNKCESDLSRNSVQQKLITVLLESSVTSISFCESNKCLKQFHRASTAACCIHYRCRPLWPFQIFPVIFVYILVLLWYMQPVLVRRIHKRLSAVGSENRTLPIRDFDVRDDNRPNNPVTPMDMLK